MSNSIKHEPTQSSQAFTKHAFVADCASANELFAQATRFLIDQSEQCFLVVHFDLEPDNQQREPQLTVLANRFETVPLNIQQWTTKLAIQSIASGQVCLESTQSQDLFTLVSAPILDTALVALFVNGTSDGSFEQKLLSTIGQEIRGWKPPEPKEKPKSARPETSLSTGNSASHLEFNSSNYSPTPEILAADTAAIAEFHQRLICVGDKEKFAKTFCDQLFTCLTERSKNTPNDGTEFCIYFALADDAEEIKLAATSTQMRPVESGLTESLESAMAESICRKQISSWPPSDNQRHALICHRALTEKLDGQHLVSSPIYSTTGSLQGVAVIASSAALSERQLRFFRVVTEQAGDRLSVIRKTEKGFFDKAISKLQQSYRSSRARFVVKLMVILLAISLIPQPYVVTNECELRPFTKRFVSAPFDARLEQCLVEPGAIVSKGQIIGRLEDDEIQLELTRNQAELNRAQRTRDGYLASHDSGKARLAELEYERLLAQNELLRYKIRNLQLTSPIDGVVISGDLNDSIGMPLEKGDAMFEIAPLDKFRVEIHAPEDDIRFIQTDQDVQMRFDAVPFEKFTGKIQRIHPESEVLENENTFVCIATLDRSVPQMRPGMQGTFRVRTVWRPILWNYLKKPLAESLRWLGW